MRIISEKTRRATKDSLQTFVIAVSGWGLAILLTFMKDLAVLAKRPAWLASGIEILSVLLFIGDGLILLAIVARITLVALREFLDELRRD